MRLAGNSKTVRMDSSTKKPYREVNDLWAEISRLKGRKLVFYSETIRNPVDSARGDNIISVAVEDGENLKSFHGFERLLEIMLENNIGREDYVIPVGGGSVTDAVGFAASVFKRGVKTINVPTTLLGMVDAAVGGKTGINFRNTKNLVGTFYFPEEIWINGDFLYTLPEREYRSGIAEMLKYGFIMDRDLLKLMLDNSSKIAGRKRSVLMSAVKRCIEDKMTVVNNDPLEKKNIRNILNYGHTIGHSLEAASGFAITHGEAISVGMIMENRFGVELMGIPPEGSAGTEDVLRSFNLPVSHKDLKQHPDISILKNALVRDKKSRQGKILMPFIREAGKAEVKSVPVEMLEEFLDREFA